MSIGENQTETPVTFANAVTGVSEGKTVLHGRYRLVRLIGRGGMGAVWLADDLELGQQRALKFLPDLIREDPEELEILKQEAAQSQTLTHRNIVRVYDFVRDAKHAAIAMEFIDGPTLKQARGAQPDRHFEVDDIAVWTEQLCDALHYAHTDAGLVHNDLKPGNLMVGQGDVLKVTDFGISQAIGATISRVSRLVSGYSTGGAGGTPAYMSPQQVMGGAVAASDDIYSFGATLHELLTGKPPYWRGEILTQLLHREAPTVDETRAEVEVAGKPVPPSWQDTIRACLEKEPKNRPASIAEVARRLGFTSLPNPAAAAKGPAAVSRMDKYAAIRNVGRDDDDDDHDEPADDATGPESPAEERSSRRGKVFAAATVAVILIVGGAYLVHSFMTTPLGADVSPESPGNSDSKTAPAPEPLREDVLLAEAEAAAAEGRYSDAAAAYSEVLAENADHVGALLGRADASMPLGDYRRVVDDLTAAIETDPSAVTSAVLARRAAALRALGEYPNAIDDFSRAIELAEANLEFTEDAEADAARAADLADLYRDRASLLVDSESPEAAAADLDRALELNPRDVEARLDRTELHLTQRRFREAIADATEVIDLAPESAEAYNYRGTGYHFLGLYPDAIADFQTALQLDPAFDEAARNLEDTRSAANLQRQRAAKEDEPRGLRGILDFFKRRGRR